MSTLFGNSVSVSQSSCSWSNIHMSTLSRFLMRAIWCAPYLAVRYFSRFFSSSSPPLLKLTFLLLVTAAWAALAAVFTGAAFFTDMGITGLGGWLWLTGPTSMLIRGDGFWTSLCLLLLERMGMPRWPSCPNRGVLFSLALILTVSLSCTVMHQVQ